MAERPPSVPEVWETIFSLEKRLDVAEFQAAVSVCHRGLSGFERRIQLLEKKVNNMQNQRPQEGFSGGGSQFDDDFDGFGDEGDGGGGQRDDDFDGCSGDESMGIRCGFFGCDLPPHSTATPHRFPTPMSKRRRTSTSQSGMPKK